MFSSGQQVLCTLASVVALVLMSGEAVAGSPGAERVSRELQQALDESVTRGLPGVVAWVNDGSGRPETGAAGVADRRTGRPIDAQDRLRIGSVTKPFVATVVLQLVAERRLNLEQPVARWLPGILPYAGKITVRQLLNHTSGVPDHASITGREIYHGNRFRYWSPRELVELIAGQAPLFPAGTSWSYSNTNYVLAGLIVERVTRRSLGSEIEHRITRPLGLHDTTFPLALPFLLSHARGYSIQYDADMNPLDELPLIDVTEHSPSQAWASGNMVSDADDVARFFRALLGGRLLPPGLLAQMKTPVLGSGYGLGLVLTETACGLVYGHDGFVAGFVVVGFNSPDGARQYVQWTNTGGIPSSAYEPLVRGLDLGVREAFEGEPCATDEMASRNRQSSRSYSGPGDGS